MGKTLVSPDWPPLTDGEVRAVLGDATAAVRWHSPRPMSAAGLVAAAGREVFVKRHHARVRSTASLDDEHAFASWLVAAGEPVPRIVPLADGAGVLAFGDWRYEAYEEAPGADLYRDVLSWSPYRSAAHASAAGAALARLHLAAAGYGAPARQFGPLMNSCAIVAAPSPGAALDRLVAARPGLAAGLARRAWRQDLARWVLPLAARASHVLRALPSQWGHGDWHPSNLTWTTAGQVAGVFDFGLANRTFAVHDLALALERSVFSWLNWPDVTLDQASAVALVRGYVSVRPLSETERAALPLVLPVAHVEYALSELEYFASVLGSAANADLAYDYLVGHARWFASAQARLPRFFT
jgi:Ser/Thr protein kinase RdoA (MazF antagonist)